MRVLAVSDKVEPSLYNGAIRQRVGDVDLILGCGDLPFYYLEFIVSMLDRPCYFVLGNHGREVEYTTDRWMEVRGPGGATNLHGRTVNEQGLLLAGLEGSMRYNSAGYQYSERGMRAQIGRLIPGLLHNRLRYGRWLDVLVAHSPPRGIHDQPDLPHTGFRVFLKLMQRFKPRYLLHGHIHLYRSDTITQTQYLDTQVINVYPFRLLEIDTQNWNGPQSG